MKSIITFTLGILLILCSCVKEDLLRQNLAPEGEPALVSLSMNMATMGSGMKTRAMTPEKEKEIVNLRVLIFDNADKIVTNRKYVGNNTSIKVDTYSGNNRKIYVVANAVEAVDTQLWAVTTLAELLALTANDTELGDILTQNNPLMMTGVAEGVDIQPGTSAIPVAIQLHFIFAKLTLIVKDAMSAEKGTLKLLGWDVIDVARNTFIYPGSVDANNTLLGNDAAWLTSGYNYYPFTEDAAAPKQASAEIYMPENRRGGRVNRALPSAPAQYYPGMSVTDGDHRGKMWYKPARATAILIHASHTTSSGDTKLTEAWIYLGADNHSNYDLERGNNYTFTVTFNGLGDINVDTNVEYINTGFKVEHGDNLNMDSHPDYRPMRIHGSNGKATIEVVDDAGLTYDKPGFSATWLKISPLDLMYHQVKQAPLNAAWQQQTGSAGSFVRGKYIPHKSVRAQLAVKGGWNAIPVGKEDDDVMTFEDATYRMCYKITDIPFEKVTAITSNMLYVYADEYLNDGGSRTAKVRVTFTNNIGLQEVKYYDISQQGYLSVYDNGVPDAGLFAQNPDGTPGTGAPKKFVIEQTEEVTLMMNPGININVQSTTTMQWGFNTELYGRADKYRNGSFLTANAVYNGVSRTPDNEPMDFGTSYRSMYGRVSGVIPNYTGGTVGPYYYPDVTKVIYHPIYKSSAARYCHEKNRDLNGDGIIDALETHWYLPSQHELQMVWIAGIQFSVDAYWSSTEVFTSNSWYVYFSSSFTASYNPKTYAYRVRCVRGI